MDRRLDYRVDSPCVIIDWLRHRFSGRRIHFLREEGKILLNGTPVTVREKAEAGDILTLFFKETQDFDYPPEDLGLKIVYEDEDITVAYKPAGVPSMPAAPHFDGNLFNGIKFLRPNGVYRVVTRLDKDTSGLVLLANNALSHSILHAEMNNIKKTYVALVRGEWSYLGIIDDPIAATDTAKRVVRNDGKPSKTQVIATKRVGEHSLLTLVAITGRTHQLRVHLSHLGHPIVGDSLYGGGEGGQLLCCEKIEFFHPVAEQKISFKWEGEADLKARFENFTKKTQKNPQ